MNRLLDGLPLWVTIGAPIGAIVALVGICLLISRASRRAGQRTHTPAVGSQRWKDRFLFGAALLGGATVYGAFVIGSYEGLTAFANEVLAWHGWKENLVPVTLDGGGAAFGFLAFRAVSRQQSPYRCYAIVWSSAGASAAFNFMQGGNSHRWEAGAYLAFLSLAGMVLFHTFLDQFETGAQFHKRTYPKFGLRWVTYTYNTACAALAWINHPPTAGTDPNVINAVEHLDQVRTDKRNRKIKNRSEYAPVAPVWTRLWPWARVAHLEAALSVAADPADVLRLNDQLETERNEATLRLERVEALHREEIDRLTAELTAVAARNRRPVAPPRAATNRATTVRTAPATTPVAPRNEDPQQAPVETPGVDYNDTTTAVQALVAAHKEADFKWSQNEVRRILGCGFPKAKELLVALEEHHARNAATSAPVEVPATVNGTHNEELLEKVTA
jgi:hypothetical protein